ncbi:MAG: hypothetical protein PPP55_10280 [Halorubrum sp.]
MEFNLPTAAGLVVLLVALGAGGLVGSGMMLLQTTLMMVVPSMIAFAAVVFAIGMKHGEFRARQA